MTLQQTLKGSQEAFPAIKLQGHAAFPQRASFLCERVERLVQLGVEVDDPEGNRNHDCKDDWEEFPDEVVAISKTEPFDLGYDSIRAVC